MLISLVRTLSRALPRTLRQGLARSHRRREDAAVLQAMSEHELSDLGLGRGEIPHVLETPPQARGTPESCADRASHLIRCDVVHGCASHSLTSTRISGFVKG